MTEIVVLIVFIINRVEFEGVHHATALCHDGSGFTLLLREDQSSRSFSQLELRFQTEK